MRKEMKKVCREIMAKTGATMGEVRDRKRHTQVEFRLGERRALLTMSSTPSDPRTVLNQIADVRRQLRAEEPVNR